MNCTAQGGHGLLLPFPLALPRLQPDLLVERDPVEGGDLEHVQVKISNSTPQLNSPFSTFLLEEILLCSELLFFHFVKSSFSQSRSPIIHICPPDTQKKL